MLVEGAIGTTAAVVIKNNLNSLFSGLQGNQSKRNKGRKFKKFTAKKKTRIMPRRGRKRKNGGRSRGRRRSLFKRKRRRTGKRGKRRSIGRPRRPLRMYPAGYPRTHKIKLRMLKQCIIYSPDREPGASPPDYAGAGWGYITFNPAQCVAPLGDVREFQEDAIDNHTHLRFNYTDGTFGNSPQPYGWDQWMDGTGSPYNRAVVEGSKTTISFVQGSTATTTTQFAVGWSSLFGNQDQGVSDPNDDTGLPKFGAYFNAVSRTEVSDMINTGVVKRLTTLRKVGEGARLIGPQSFSYNYSRKKLAARYKRLGVVIPALFATDLQHAQHADSRRWDFTHATQPGVNPQIRFIIADIGADTAPTPLHCIISIEYSLTLFSGSISQGSIL